MSAQRADKRIRGFQHAFMSNTKWRTLFREIIASNINIEYAIWKIADAEEVMIKRMPYEVDLHTTRFQDGLFQPFEYKYIEYIRIPREYKPYQQVGLVKYQAINELHAYLSQTGRQYPLFLQSDSLTIQAYK
jgi:hypothetical protein